MNARTLVIIALCVLFIVFVMARSVETFTDENSLRLSAETMEMLLKSKDMKMPANMPAPPEIFKALRGLIDKYDKPELWDHAKRVHDKDPGQLARMQLGLQ